MASTGVHAQFVTKAYRSVIYNPVLCDSLCEVMVANLVSPTLPRGPFIYRDILKHKFKSSKTFYFQLGAGEMP